MNPTKLMNYNQRSTWRVTNVPNVHFDDVEGIDEIKEELQFLSNYLLNPYEVAASGAKVPHGVLLSGPPGCGKTLLAKALANETSVSLFYATGSEFDEMYVGIGAERVRKLFDEAKKNAPSIIFIDEIDSIGTKRESSNMSSSYANLTINQLLSEMSGFKDHEGVVVIGATNMPEVLEPALLRSGRFDLKLEIQKPDLEGRVRILKRHARNKPLDDSVNFIDIAKTTAGCTGADLENILNQAALASAIHEKNRITHDDINYALELVLMGKERPSTFIPAEVRRNTAYHEAGHALSSLLIDETDPIRKATIIPRGQALGMVSHVPAEESLFQQSKSDLEKRLVVCMGGRVSEELAFGKENVTTGASSDLQQASRIARHILMTFGMNSEHGFETITDTNFKFLSDQEKKIIDIEVNKILDKSYYTAKMLLLYNWEKVSVIAESLLEKETLTGEEIDRLLSTIDISN